MTRPEEYREEHMAENTFDRKKFLTVLGRAGAGTCMCGAVLGSLRALGAEPDICIDDESVPRERIAPAQLFADDYQI